MAVHTGSGVEYRASADKPHIAGLVEETLGGREIFPNICKKVWNSSSICQVEETYSNRPQGGAFEQGSICTHGAGIFRLLNQSIHCGAPETLKTRYRAPSRDACSSGRQS
jgi:hypothetical protein